MDSSIARERITSVIRPDSITSSQGDFLATHVTVGGLELLSKFELMPSAGRRYTEDHVYRSLVLNPDNRHQFVAVYGQSGTGKSHLIRWFEAKYRYDKPDSEVILFIRRSDNTLKGTIKQLLSTPEVQTIANREVYERLVRATAFEDEERLKGRIYYDFVNEVECDEGAHGISLSNVRKKRLVAFLANEMVKEHLMSPDGPIERIYSRIAENSNVDRDTIAQFEKADFVISADLYDEINGSADPKAVKQARALMADDGGLEEADKIASYLNQFVNDVIQRCAGIQPGDFRDIFQDIRRDLAKIGKNLTLFIEDVTSFTGVDDALLDTLLVDHGSDDSLCRISSFVGTTSNYLQNHFRDNHKDRITRYIYIPSGIFEEDKLFEFVARYLNAMSLSSEAINQWADNHALASEYPVHDVKEGNNWEFVTIADGKQLCLYPFTRHSIQYLYDHVLSAGQQTPRYIIRDIIEPVVNDALYNKASFPSEGGQSISYDQKLAYRINSQIDDRALANRLLRFLTIWGDGTPFQTNKDGVTYYSAIRSDILSELGFPEISLLDGPNKPPSPPDKKPDDKKPPKPIVEPVKPLVSDAVRERIDKALIVLNEWAGGKSIDVSTTGGAAGVLNSALRDLNAFVGTAINWQAEGVSADNIAKINASSRRFVTLSNQRRGGTGFYVLPADTNSVPVISAFVRWRYYGNSSWNYDDAEFDVYIVTNWLQSVKNAIVSAVNDARDTGTSYIQAAICAEAYRTILLGEYKGDTLSSFGIEHLFKDSHTDIGSTAHCKEWKSLVGLLSQKNDDKVNADTVRQYFNIRQGRQGTSSGGVTVLDYPRFVRALSEAKSGDLTLPPSVMEQKDSVTTRDRAFQYYSKISQRIARVAEAESERAKQLLELIDEHLYDEEYGIDEEAILEFVDSVNQFYSEVNKSKMPIVYRSADRIKKNAKQISGAIKQTRKALQKNTPLAVILAFSTDPLNYLDMLASFLGQLQGDVKRAEGWIATKETTLGASSGLVASSERYQQELASLDECIALLEEGSNDDC